MIKSIMNACLSMSNKWTQSHKSNESDHEIEIESQTQSQPPSPTRPGSSTASPPIMYLDTDLKFPHMRYKFDNNEKVFSKIDKLYLTTSAFSPTIHISAPGGFVKNLHNMCEKAL